MTTKDKTPLPSTEPIQKRTLPEGKNGSLWFLLPVGLLGFLLSIQAVLIVMSTGDPSFAVEEDYYAKATQWDVRMQQEAENVRVGWTCALRLLPGSGTHRELELTLLDAEGTPIRGAVATVEAFHNARASQKQQLDFRETTAGRYRSNVEVYKNGLWEVRLRVRRGAELFTHTERVDWITQPVSGAHAGKGQTR